jgi:hypothetical protein
VIHTFAKKVVRSAGKGCGLGSPENCVILEKNDTFN